MRIASCILWILPALAACAETTDGYDDANGRGGDDGAANLEKVGTGEDPCAPGYVMDGDTCALDEDATGASCDDPIALDGETGTLRFELSGGDSVATSDCGGAGPERIFAVHRDSPARFAYAVSGPDVSIVVHVRTDCDDEASEIGCCACPSNQGILDVGTTFLFVDTAEPTEGGTFQLSWQLTPCGDATDTDGDCAGG